MSIKDFLEDHQHQLTRVFGNLDNIMVKERHEDLMKMMQPYQQNYQDFNKFRQYSGRLSSVLKDPTFLQSLYANENGVEAENIYANAYNQLGWSPEDVAFYEEAKGKFSGQGVNNYNQKLTDFILQNQPRLVSRGSLGNQLAQNFTQVAGGLGLQKPKKEIKTVGNNLVQIDEETGETNEIYRGEPKWKRESGLQIAVVEDENSPTGLSFRVPFVDQSGNIEFRQTPGATEDDLQMYLATVMNKSTDWKEKADYMQGLKIDFKSMFGGSGKGGLKGMLDDLLNLNETFDYTTLKDFAKKSRNYNNLSEEEMKDYRAKQKELTARYGMTWQELNGLIETIGDAKDDKTAKRLFDQYVGAIGERRTEIQTQGTDIQDAFQEFQKKMQAGQMSMEEFKAAILKEWERIKNELYPEIRKQIEAYLSQNGFFK